MTARMWKWERGTTWRFGVREFSLPVCTVCILEFLYTTKNFHDINQINQNKKIQLQRFKLFAIGPFFSL